MSRVPAALARDLAREAELGRVLRALASATIPVLLVKGAAYRGREYARGERPCHDADLLVGPRDFRRAQAVLRRLGYAVRVRGEAHASRPGTGFAVDLHAGLYPDGDRGLWERSEPVAVAGGAARVLRSSDAFVYALWHGVLRHVAVTGRLLEDLARIAARSGGDAFWREVAAGLRERRLEAAASLVLPALRSRGVRAPAALAAARHGMEARLLRWALRRGARGGTGHLLMALAGRDRWRAAGRLARSFSRGSFGP